jgi:hypothetical protein
MSLFLSYAHQDLDVVTSLRRDLEDLGQTVWLDESLHGGQIWWDEILRQVRSCNGFILAVSALSLDSEACLAEWEYAVALARPFLPVRIDATEWTAAPDRMRQSQHIDYKPDDADSVKALVRSLGAFAQTVPLPEVLPPSPPTPLSYHERYAKLFGQATLTFDDQINYFARLTTDVDSAIQGLHGGALTRSSHSPVWPIWDRILARPLFALKSDDRHERRAKFPRSPNASTAHTFAARSDSL